MEVEAILQAITNVGFPIAVCVYLLYFVTQILNKFVEVMNENTMALEALRQEFHEHFNSEGGAT